MALKFFRKNLLDLSNTLPTFTITDASASNTGEVFTNLMRNRNNNSGWSTTDSVDAGSTTMIVNFGQTESFKEILLIGMNFKNFTLKYYDGSVYAPFSTPIAFTDNTLSSAQYSFDEVFTTALELKINSTMTANQDKYLKQFIITDALGTVSVQPEIQLQWDKDRKATKFLSGKTFVAKSVGGLNCRIRMKTVSNEADLSLFESLYNTYEGFLTWITGGDVSELETVREGYRLEDIFLMDVSNEYQPTFNDGRWYMGMPIDIRLVEVS